MDADDPIRVILIEFDRRGAGEPGPHLRGWQRAVVIVGPGPQLWGRQRAGAIVGTGLRERRPMQQTHTWLYRSTIEAVAVWRRTERTPRRHWTSRLIKR